MCVYRVRRTGIYCGGMVTRWGCPIPEIELNRNLTDRG